MATYRITWGYTDMPVEPASSAIKHTRSGAFNLAYQRLYEHLGVTGGRDTKRGWLAHDVLADWLKDRSKQACVAVDREWQIAIVREA